MTLEELCIFLPKSKRKASYGNEKGQYPFYTSSMVCKKYCDEYDYDTESLIIGDGGGPNINYNILFSVSDHCYVLQKKNDIVYLKYVYYYILNNLNMLNELYTGVAIKNISKTNIENIQIPVPSLERQEYIIEYLSFIHEQRNKTLIQSNKELATLNEYYIKNQILFGTYDTQPLGELFNLNGNGKTNTKDLSNSGNYPFYKASVNNPSGLHNSYDFDGDEYLLIIKSGGSSIKPLSRSYGIGKVFLVNGKSAANIAVFKLTPKTENKIKYLYYYLLNEQLEIQKLAKYCTNNGNIDMKELMQLQIPIPSLERQEEYIKYCENNQKEIENNQKEIENNQKEIENNIHIASEFLNKML